MRVRPAWRSLGVLALVAVLIVGGLALLRSRRGAIDVRARATSAAHAQPSDESEFAAATVAPAAAPTDDQRIELSRSASALADAAPSPTPAERAPNPSTRRLDGTLVVVDVHGVVQPAQSGAFELIAIATVADSARAASSAERRSYRVEISAGTWHALVDDAARVTTLRIEQFRGENARVNLIDAYDALAWPASNRLELRARVAQRTRLEVVDARTQAPLSDVTLVLGAEVPNDDQLHPGAALGRETLAHGLASPIDVDELIERVRGDTLQLHVGSPTYAWRAVELDLVCGGTRRVALERGGRLRVSFSGPSPARGATLCLYALRSGSAARVPACELILDAAHGNTIDDLVPGEYALRAEHGSWFRRPFVLGEAVARVDAERDTHVELELRAAPNVERGELHGTLLVPRAWIELAAARGESSSRGGSLTRLDDAVAGFDSYQSFIARPAADRRAGFAALEWRARDIPSGNYEIDIDELGLAARIDVRPGISNEFELVAAPPVELQVIAVDAASGADIEHAHVSWLTRSADGRTHRRWIRARPHAAGRGQAIDAPAGPIVVRASADEHRSQSIELDLATAPGVVVLRLPRTLSVDIKLRDGDAFVPFPTEWARELTVTPDSGTLVGATMPPFVRQLLVDAPGTYTIAFPKLAGYRPIPTQSIAVVEGEHVEHVVRLEREQL